MNKLFIHFSSGKKTPILELSDSQFSKLKADLKDPAKDLITLTVKSNQRKLVIPRTNIEVIEQLPEQTRSINSILQD